MPIGFPLANTNIRDWCVPGDRVTTQSEKTIMDLLEFARGPALQVASLIFAAGLIWRIIHLFLIFASLLLFFVTQVQDLTELKASNILG